MRIFLALNANFSSRDPGARDWISKYARELGSLGLSCTLFDARSDVLPEKALVHFFSNFDAETWSVLESAGRKIVVTPALRGGMTGTGLDRWRTPPLTWMRAIVQLRWPPVEEKSFRRTGSHYLVTSETARRKLSMGWGIADARITVFGEDPKTAAQIASQVYLGLI